MPHCFPVYWSILPLVKPLNPCVVVFSYGRVSFLFRIGSIFAFSLPSVAEKPIQCFLQVLTGLPIIFIIKHARYDRSS